MLFILSGDVLAGKTRWLTHVVGMLAEQGVVSRGVLAPGVWKRFLENDEIKRVKQGIDAVLLPEARKLPFATRRDADSEIAPSRILLKSTQSDQAKLGWAISDDAIAEVNHHFDEITATVEGTDTTEARTNLLVVDELGRLELLHDQGLTSALALVEKGPTNLYDHALCVVRDVLCDTALKRFEGLWPEVCVISPDEESLQRIRSVYDLPPCK